MPLPFVQLAASIWRQYIVDGNPGSGLYNTERPEIIVWGTKVEQVLGEHDTDIDALQATDITHAADIATNAADIVTLQGEVQPIARGGTGATTAAGAATALGPELAGLLFPVGSVLMNTTGTNPGTYLTGTTWVAKAEGRAIVGVGNNAQAVWAAGEQRGAETHTLTIDELPTHTHQAGALATSIAGNHAHTSSFAQLTLTGPGGSLQGIASGGFDSWQFMQAVMQGAGNHQHTITGQVSHTGAGIPHNNVQPSEGIYIWERTV